MLGGLVCRRATLSARQRGVAVSARRTSERGASTTSGRREAERLGKALSRAGVASRRKSEEIIFSGRVAINGQVVTKPETRVTVGVDKIELDGVVLGGAPASKVDHQYFMVNKPKGYMCSSDESCKKSVLGLFRPWMDKYVEKRERSAGSRRDKGDESDAGDSLILPPRLFTVGRLDVATTGLLLVTSDGGWANEIAHPKYGVLKEYVVTCDSKVKLAHLERIAEGTEVEGTYVTPKRVEAFDRVTGDPKYEYKVKIVVGEGKKHEVRELVACTGLQVQSLKRTKVGKLCLESLLIGRFRKLKKKELELPKKNFAHF